MSSPLDPSPATAPIPHNQLHNQHPPQPPPPPKIQPKTIGEDGTTSRNSLQTFDTLGTDNNAQYFPLGFRFADGRQS